MDLQRSVATGKHPLFLVDNSGLICFSNTDAEEMLGYSAADLCGKPFNMVVRTELDDSGEDVFHGADHQLVQNSFEIGGEFTSSAGTLIRTQLSISPIKNERDQHVYFAVMANTLNEGQHAMRDGGQDRRRLDPLTELINRSEFERLLDDLIDDAAISARTHALLYYDLDQFRLINDTSGHHAGDELLRKVADILATNLGRGAILARLGGDEFAVLVNNVDRVAACKEARRLLDWIQGVSFSWESRVHRVDACVGVVSIDEHSRSRAVVMSQADAALFAAKDMGRGSVQYFRATDAKLSRICADMEWANRLNEALLLDSFEFVSQPIVALHDSSESCHCEVLLRLRAEEGLLLPGVFLPSAERFGLAENIDQWVIEHFFNFLERRPEFNHTGMLYTINLSGDSIGRSHFLEYVLKQLNRFHVLPEIICFEITETAAVSNLEAARRFIADVRGLGCRFALDDFGSGMSSYGYLNELPVDFVKIDGQFVRDIDTNAVNEVIVRTVVEICHTMGKQVIAEFVETEAVCEQLRKMGVDFAQGYYFGRPAPLEKPLPLEVRQ